MTDPVLAGTRAELAGLLADARRVGDPVALVPTMGALHEGHASLMRAARARTAGPVVVSLFVNPLQFAPGEDLDRYPRTLPDDLALCASQGVDLVFAPAVDEVYPGGSPEITVDPGPLGGTLEGVSRPTHFRGVLTVVAKLFGLVRPDLAVFGEKDYQQMALIRRMSDDLCLGVEVVGAETVRDDDGLALSSRNRFLSASERDHALALSRALRAARSAAAGGAGAALERARGVLEAAEGVELDYLALTAPDLGAPPSSGPARILVAARVGPTRLIDNLPLTLGAVDARTASLPT